MPAPIEQLIKSISSSTSRRPTDDGGRLVGPVSYTDVLRAVLGPKPYLS